MSLSSVTVVVNALRLGSRMPRQTAEPAVIRQESSTLFGTLK
jgi:hypothetical protein